MYPIISLLDRSIEVRFESKSYSYSFSRRGGDGFQWTKLDRDALRRTFVRNQERLNGCEIGETIVRKVVIVVDLSKDDKYDFSYVFLWPHCVKLILPRGVQQSLSLFVFFSFSLLFLFPPFFPSDVRSSCLVGACTRLTHPPMSRVSTRGNYLVSRLPSRVGPMENEHRYQRLPNWTRIVFNFRRELTNESDNAFQPTATNVNKNHLKRVSLSHA